MARQELNLTFSSLIRPDRLWTRTEVLAKPSPVPPSRGIYGWYFRTVPPGVPTDGCLLQDGLTLLYAGISPKDEVSTQNLRRRISQHYRGNAEGSTLRLTLGVLLEPLSDFQLRRVGSGKRMTLTHLGEQWLDQWMDQNALVCWLEHPTPWIVEREVLGSVSLPLNLQGNQHHPFASRLSAIRSEAKMLARETPIASEQNQRRK